MGKGILVLDEMPACCLTCDLCHYDNDFKTWVCCASKIQMKACDDPTSRRYDCPLKEAPEHALIWDVYDDDYNMGYNAALDEILGDKEVCDG